ncbi:MAG: lysylphosphatidylglycerol synthase domain-containing protein [Bacteroidota bacterium]
MEKSVDTPKQKLYSFYWWKWLVFVLAAFGLYYQLFQNQNLSSAWNQYQNNVSEHAVLLTIIVFVLMLINWSVEAVRWNSLLRKVEAIKFIDALKATFSGISFAMFTPNRVGEYAGRVLFIQTVSRWRVLIVTTIGIYAQLLCTILFGIIGLAFQMILNRDLHSYQYIEWTVIILLILSAILLFILYFNIGLIENVLERFSFLSKVKIYLKVLLHYSTKELFNVFSLSVLRYFVFTVQYLLLLQMFNIQIPWMEGAALIATIFLVQTIIPSIAIAEVGIRGNVALFFLSSYSSNQLGIVSAAWGLWLINLVIPAVIGMILILISRGIKRK